MLVNIFCVRLQIRQDKIKFNLDESQLSISDTAIDYTIRFNTVDTSTPNVIRTKPDAIMTSPSSDSNYTKEINTQSNITTYTSHTKIFRSSELTRTGQDYDVDLKAVVYPNGTGLVTTTRR